MIQISPTRRQPVGGAFWLLEGELMRRAENSPFNGQNSMLI